jgi:hypothetical protein
MNAENQFRLLKRVEDHLSEALVAASQLPGGAPLKKKISDALVTATAWRSDQEAELPEEAT